MDAAGLEEIIEQVIARLAGGAPPSPTALTLLLRCYGRTDRHDIQAALEPALAVALDLHTQAQSTSERAEWLVLFADVGTLSADDRLRGSVEGLVAGLRHEWGRSREIVSIASSTEACLRVSGRLDLGSIAVDAIDELERIVGATYRPGAGLTGQEPAETPIVLADHIAVSSALLTAFEVSARLPYSMLAEELMQFARRRLWDETAGCFVDPDHAPDEVFRLNCRAARVMLRLGALHRDADYVAAAIIGPDAAYGQDAARILVSQHAASCGLGADQAEYGLALLEWLDL